MKKLSARQLEIVNTALDIMADDSMQGLTTKTLALALNVSEPALYRHFKSKQDILLSLIVMYKEFLLNLFKNDNNKDRINAVDEINDLYHKMFQSFVRRPALSVIIFSEDLFKYDRRLSKEVYSLIEFTQIHIVQILKSGLRKNEIRSDIPVKQLSWMIMGTMRMLVSKWRISGYTLDLVKEGRQMNSVFYKLLMNEPSRTS